MTGLPNSLDALATGTTLDGYLITGLIGQGGYGVVYVARDVSSNRTVAIKEYLPSSIAGRAANGDVAPRSAETANAFATGLKGFLREANLLSEFAHPALVAVHRAWEQNGTAYMAMQYYPGKTLRDMRIKAGVAMTEAHIRALMSPVFEAVSELHAHRVIHRDVSPDNILVMPTGETVLLDLGAARQVLGGMTQALTTILKPGFAPIEQYVEDGSMEQGRWTDVYGLAAVIYFLATGKPPTPATSRIVRDSLPPLAEAAPGTAYSAPFVTAVTRALSVRAIDRFKSINEFRGALGWVSMPRPATGPLDTTATATPLSPEQLRAVTQPAATPVTGHVRADSVAAPPVAVRAAPVSPQRTAAAGAPTALGELRGAAGSYDAAGGGSRRLLPIIAVVALVVVIVAAFFLLR
jgi:serine/threonine protein kinase